MNEEKEVKTYNCSKCWNILKEVKSATSKNPNRIFYACVNKKCKGFFVEWKDKVKAKEVLPGEISFDVACTRCRYDDGCYKRVSESKLNFGRSYWACAAPLCKSNFICWC